MARSVNRITLVGNVGSDPDVRKTAAGTTVAHLSLATNRSYEHNGETRELTQWHRLTFWSSAAEVVAEHVRKGDRLYVEGRVEYGSYERDGQSIPTAEVVVREFVFLGSPFGSASRVGTAAELEAVGATEDG